MTSTTPATRKATKATPRTFAHDRDESEACEAGTPGCAIDHNQDHGSCETW